MKHISVATIDSPEFINITSINPLVSKCEIKVLYVGENRNRSAISKEVATEMAKTLPGTPIVGYYIESKEDFGDHGDQMIIDSEGIKFKSLTRPYGFVAPDSKIQFQKFEEYDETGNKIIRDYLMTEGYLQTGQYEECKKTLTQGKPQSMELDSKTLKGYWSKDANKGIDFFIINDAIFSKLCILGNDIEPCFEGASVTAPEVSSHFSLDEDFTNTLYNMMKELKEITFSLKNQGGNSMNEEVKAPEVEENVAPEIVQTEKFSVNQDKTNSTDMVENQNITEEFTKKNDDDDDEKKKDNTEDSKSEDLKENENENTKEDEEDDEKKEPKKNHSLEEEDLNKKFESLNQKFEELQNSYSLLQAENEKLLAFKKEQENKQKDALIESFYMLSDEDKEDVITNKSKYSLDEIEAKLSVICVRKKVNFTKEENEEDKLSFTTYNLNQTESDSLPAWLRAVENHRKKED